jgi:hypothetical protein
VAEIAKATLFGHRETTTRDRATKASGHRSGTTEFRADVNCRNTAALPSRQIGLVLGDAPTSVCSFLGAIARMYD